MDLFQQSFEFLQLYPTDILSIPILLQILREIFHLIYPPVVIAHELAETNSEPLFVLGRIQHLPYFFL